MTDASEPRPEPREAYRRFRPMTTRWMDNDLYGHLNNVVYYSLFDSAVNGYLIDAGALDIHAGGVIGLVVETHCNYFAPLAFPQLTDREHEILDLLARGHANAAIAARLHISDKTVRNHVSNIFTKLAVADRAQAIIRAREAGLGGPSDRQHTGEPR